MNEEEEQDEFEGFGLWDFLTLWIGIGAIVIVLTEIVLP